jgi:hypothetical protein
MTYLPSFFTGDAGIIIELLPCGYELDGHGPQTAGPTAML